MKGRKTEPRRYCHVALVELPGVVEFPLDMLRYDSCFPMRSQDVAAIHNSLSRPGTDGHVAERKVFLVHYGDEAEPRWTTERWESFGCRIRPVDPATLRLPEPSTPTVPEKYEKDLMLRIAFQSGWRDGEAGSGAVNDRMTLEGRQAYRAGVEAGSRGRFTVRKSDLMFRVTPTEGVTGSNASEGD